NDYSGVGWIRAAEWVPYQRATFVTPPFAGYVSGHSTFSRAAAEVLTAFTGDAFFPGGMGEFHCPAGEYLAFEYGPTEDITLQWATYRDAADESGISRIYGGIHVAADDGPGRKMGETAGQNAYAHAKRYYAGQVFNHKGDRNGDKRIDLSELLRLIQFFNFKSYHCDGSSEDGYAPGPGGIGCTPHDSDYNAQNWVISLSELLRFVQIFNVGGYCKCSEQVPATEDGWCPAS
ncbi:MAG: vanadium-dependent haloperoxidase, partial [Candidatus Hydrogenedentes bacterium]|nr:vanadium-dependent haloperoxidase [Candidatus Hydrogenedentota bacterium]